VCRADKKEKSMKKLMMVLVAGGLALAANAAATSWKVGAAKVNGADGNLFTGSMYLFCADLTSVASVSQALSEGKDVTTLGSIHTMSASSGTVSASAAANQFVSDAFTANTGYDFFYVLVDGDKFLVSATKDDIIAQATTTQSIAFGNQETFTKNASNWASSSAVPEPTSGLMLLLGMAGLALKRKRA
jgi:hypothetical protein